MPTRVSHVLLTHLRFTSTNACARLDQSRRRGCNLTERYRTLEDNVRKQNSVTLSQDSSSPVRVQRTLHESGDARRKPVTFMGFSIPEEPIPPADEECCMSGCAVCVYDLYEESLLEYKASVEKLRGTLAALSIPENEWPTHIRTTRTPSTGSGTSVRQKGVVLSAFEEMERALEEKRTKRAAGEAEKRARGEMLECDGERVGIGQMAEGIRWILFPYR